VTAIELLHQIIDYIYIVEGTSTPIWIRTAHAQTSCKSFT